MTAKRKPERLRVPFLYRDDGVRFRRGADGRYRLDGGSWSDGYAFGRLMETGMFSVWKGKPCK